MDKERKCLLNARLRNLERKFAKLKEHADLTDECLEIQREIDSIKNELNS